MIQKLDPESLEEEHVLVLPTQSLEDSHLLGDGFRWLETRGLERIQELLLAEGRFLPRSTAEEDPALKQIIPYVVVHCGPEILLLQRSRKGGEPRLYDRLSIGVGGHINPELCPDAELVMQGLRRELNEELVLGDRELENLDIVPVGSLNDDSNDVGKVHFGLVYLARSAHTGVRVREEELLSGEFVGLQDLRERLSDMETWSQWVTRALLEESHAGRIWS